MEAASVAGAVRHRLGALVIAGALADLVERTGFYGCRDEVARRAGGLPRSAWGTASPIPGSASRSSASSATTHWAAESILALKPGADVRCRGYELTFDGVTTAGTELRETWWRVHGARDGEVDRHIEPSKREFPVEQQHHHRGRHSCARRGQLYLSLGESIRDGSVGVRLYYNPLVLLIWLGALVMILGGALSLSDRRLRVGAPKPARAKPSLAASRVTAMRGRNHPLICAQPLRSRCCAVAACRRRSWPCSPTKCCRIRGSKPALAHLRRICAAWSARISRSTIPKPRSRSDLRLLVRERLNAGDTDSAGAGFRRRPLWRVRAAEAAAWRCTPCCYGAPRQPWVPGGAPHHVLGYRRRCRPIALQR